MAPFRSLRISALRACGQWYTPRATGEALTRAGASSEGVAENGRKLPVNSPAAQHRLAVSAPGGPEAANRTSGPDAGSYCDLDATPRAVLTDKELQ